MSTFRSAGAAAALLLALPLTSVSAGAAPVSSSAALSAPYAQTLGVSQGDVTQVQYRRRGGGGGAGPIIGGLAAGAIIGGIIASQGRPYYYGPGYYAPPPPVYYQPAPAPYYAPPANGDAEAYCMQRYRSYDPASGTYLNNDGNRYPCP